MLEWSGTVSRTRHEFLTGVAGKPNTYFGRGTASQARKVLILGPVDSPSYHRVRWEIHLGVAWDR
jgi:hypothetical protein